MNASLLLRALAADLWIFARLVTTVSRQVRIEGFRSFGLEYGVFFMKDRCRQIRYDAVGFTLLEVMVAMAIIAITLTAVLGSQSQSVSLAGKAKFNTTAPLLAQSKISEIEVVKEDNLADDSGDFGDDFPGYTWQYSLHQVDFEKPENVSDQLRRIDLTVSWGEGDQYQYHLRLYRFVSAQE